MQIITGKVLKPFNVALLGTPGIGKSTWAAGAPKPLFIGAEENDELDVARLPKPKSYDNFIEQLAWIVKTKPDYKTLVVDTIDSIENLLHTKILDDDKKGVRSMNKAHGGYGAAYEIATSDFLSMRDNYLRVIRDEIGMNIIILAHCKKVTAVDTIVGMQYDTYEMCLHQKAQGVIVDWVSAVFFANYVSHNRDDLNNSSKVFAMGDGERVLLTEKRPGHLGKNRFGLPYEMPLEFNEFYSRYQAYFANGEKLSLEQITTKAIGVAENVKDEGLKQKILSSIVQAGQDAKKIERILNRTEEIVGAY